MTNLEKAIELERLRHEAHDACVSCGHVFQYGETTHLGYTEDQTPMYACDACSSKLVGKSVRTFFMPHPYTIPPDDSFLWRYMDFAKFVSLLSTRSLFFARADTFEDQFEGAKGVKANKAEWDAHYLAFFEQAMRAPPPGAPSFNRTDEEIAQSAAELLKQLEATGKLSKLHTFISCWYENRNESEAMWRLYTSLFANAVAIRTTAGRLYRALGRSPSVAIGRVKYLDLRVQFAGPNDAFWRKRISFAHENEVRALLMDFACKERGIPQDCDLHELIEAIFVSPSAPGWFAPLVKDVASKYGVEAPIHASTLNDEHFF